MFRISNLLSVYLISEPHRMGFLKFCKNMHKIMLEAYHARIKGGVTADGEVQECFLRTP